MRDEHLWALHVLTVRVLHRNAPNQAPDLIREFIVLGNCGRQSDQRKSLLPEES